VEQGGWTAGFPVTAHTTVTMTSAAHDHRFRGGGPPPECPKLSCSVSVRSLFALFALWASGCTAMRIVPPEHPTSRLGPDHGEIGLELRDFTVANATSDEAWGAREDLQRSFLEYLEANGRYAEDRASAVPVRLEVVVRLDQTREVTGILDALFFYPGCGFMLPIVPHWGEAVVEVELRASVEGQGDRPEPLSVEVSAPYSMILYSWYRTGPIEDAFRRAYAIAFQQIGERLAERLRRPWPALAEALEARREAKNVALSAATSSTATITIASTSSTALTSSIALEIPEAPKVALAAHALSLPTYLDPPQQIVLPPDEFGIITHPLGGARHDLIGRYLGALGGVELARFEGGANVESRASTRSSSSELVGSGEAQAEGYRIALFRPPDRTGFFFPPTIGLLSQTITISGFREEVPVFSSRSTGTDIAARASDPATGAPIDLHEPIAYDLKLKSAFIGQGLGLNLVVGDENAQLFFTIAGTMNLFELRYTDVKIHQSQVEGASVAFFHSAALNAQVGFAIPSWHIALRAAVQKDWYFEFDYPKPVEFQATTTFNEEKQVFERERVFVSGAALSTYNWQLSAVVLF
jgi:hypothetical protein